MRSPRWSWGRGTLPRIRPPAASHLRIAAAVACLAAGVWLFVLAGQERRLVDAGDALSAGRTARATRLADGASGPTIGGRAARTLAAAALQRGDLVEAERQITRAVRLAPNDWSLQRDRAVLLQRRGMTVSAAVVMRRALRLNPRLVLPPGFVAGRGAAAP